MGWRKLAPSMKNDKPSPFRGVPVAVLPMYGIVRFATTTRTKRPACRHLVELNRSALGLTCDELLALVASDPVQSLIMKWRNNAAGSQIQQDIEAQVRDGADNLQQALSARQARLAAWDLQRDEVQRCASGLVEQMDRRAVRGMASKIKHATGGAMPTSVQIYKWGYDLALKARADGLQGFNPDWDFEMTAIAFGDELELELRYIDPSVGELLNPTTMKTLQDFEAQRTQTEGVVELV